MPNLLENGLFSSLVVRDEPSLQENALYEKRSIHQMWKHLGVRDGLITDGYRCSPGNKEELTT